MSTWVGLETDDGIIRMGADHSCRVLGECFCNRVGFSWRIVRMCLCGRGVKGEGGARVVVSFGTADINGRMHAHAHGEGEDGRGVVWTIKQVIDVDANIELVRGSSSNYSS